MLHACPTGQSALVAQPPPVLERDALLLVEPPVVVSAPPVPELVAPVVVAADVLLPGPLPPPPWPLVLDDVPPLLAAPSLKLSNPRIRPHPGSPAKISATHPIYLVIRRMGRAYHGANAERIRCDASFCELRSRDHRLGEIRSLELHVVRLCLIKIRSTQVGTKQTRPLEGRLH